MATKDLTVLIRAKNVTAAGLSAAGNAIKNFSKRAVAFTKAAVIAFAAVGAAAVAVGRKMVEAYNVQAAAEGKLTAVLKATGYAAGFTTSQLKEQAAQLQKTTGVGDEVILSMQGILASFNKVRGDNFKRATVAALDMASVLKKSGASAAEVEGAATQLGKALQDPVGQLGMLSRVGIAFTEQQKGQIKAMVEAGDLAEAQALILSELETRFGGTAKAVADAQHGTMQLKAAFGDMKEEIGRAIVETDSFDGIIAAVTKSIENLTESGAIELWAQNVRSALEFLAPAVSAVGKAFGWMKEKVAGAAAFWGAIAGGSGVNEAVAAMDKIPKMIAEEKAAKLETIKAEREKRKQARAQQEEEEKARLAAVREIAEAEEEAAKKAKKQAEELKKLAKERAELETKYAEELDNEREKAWQNEKKRAEDELEKQREIAAMTVAEFIRAAKEKKDAAEGTRKEDERAAKIEGKIGRGIKVSRNDREFLDAWKKIQNAKGQLNPLQEQINVAQDNLKQMEQQNSTLTDILGKLDDIDKNQQKLLAAG